MLKITFPNRRGMKTNPEKEGNFVFRDSLTFYPERKTPNWAFFVILVLNELTTSVSILLHSNHTPHDRKAQPFFLFYLEMKKGKFSR